MKNRLYILKKIGKYINKSKLAVVMLVVFGFIAIPIPLISPYIFSVLIDDVLVGQQMELFIYVCLGLLGVYIARFIVDLVNLICANKLLNRFTFSLRRDIWNKYIRISFKKYESYDAGDLKMRLFEDVGSLDNFLKDQIVDYTFNIILVIAYFIVSLTINYQFTLICLGIIPIVFLVNHLIGKGMSKMNEKIRQVEEGYYSFEHNSFQYWKEIKSLNVEDTFVKRFTKFRITLAKLGMKRIKYWFYGEVFNDFVMNYLSKVVIYIIGATFVLNGNLSIGFLFMFAEYFGSLFSCLELLNRKNVELRINMPYYKRIFEILDLEEENERDKLPVNKVSNITADNIEFSYDEKGQKVINNIDVNLNKGDYIAIIGKSGCGKTTLLKLLLNIYETDKGNINIDNININNINKRSLYEKIGVVMQDSYLFNMSIEENLKLGNRFASKKEIKEACQKANILEFIESLPDGFRTIIGERGIKLSGGQKQRLTIAQALIKKPQVIFFDEATSSLDRMSEDIINKSINEISEETTVVVISHKPASVLRAKKVIVIEAGQIIAEGSHAQLLNTNTLYKNMVG